MEIKTQRNNKDVVMELLEHHLNVMKGKGEEITTDTVEELYLKYYKLVLENN